MSDVLIQVWDSYQSQVIPKSAGKVQIDECRRAFFAGAQALNGLYAQFNIEIQDEINGFVDDVTSGKT